MKTNTPLLSLSIASSFAILTAISASSANEGQSTMDHKMDHAADHQMNHDKMDHSQMNADSMCGMIMGEGVINALDVKDSKVNISHEPIDSIGWPEMKMDFSILKPIDLAAFAAKERVHFMLKKEKDASYSISMMCSLDIEEGAHQACMGKMHEAAMEQAAVSGQKCSMSDMHGMTETKETDHNSHH